jgi:hypothetical protein
VNGVGKHLGIKKQQYNFKYIGTQMENIKKSVFLDTLLGYGYREKVTH